MAVPFRTAKDGGYKDPANGQTVPVMFAARPPVVVYETDVSAVTAGGDRAGWIDGSPANLADGASIACRFDLGPDWDQYTLLQINVRSTTAVSLSNISPSFGDALFPGSNTTRTVNSAYAVTAAIAYFTVTTANGAGAFYVRPMGRFMNVNLTNTAGSGAQGALSKVTVAAYPA